MSQSLQPPRSPEAIFAEIGGLPNSCTHAEYHAFAQEVQALAPGRLLVFGVGRDSAAWCEVNHDGETLFLENNPEWIERISSQVGAERIQQVDYHYRFEQWESDGLGSDAVPLPESASDLPSSGTWDAIFVDAPWGPTFGRHQSTHLATIAVKPGGFIALHDCERPREQLVCQHLLESRGFQLVREVERLRIYRAGN